MSSLPRVEEEQDLGSRLDSTYYLLPTPLLSPNMLVSSRLGLRFRWQSGDRNRADLAILVVEVRICRRSGLGPRRCKPLAAA